MCLTSQTGNSILLIDLGDWVNVIYSVPANIQLQSCTSMLSTHHTFDNR